MAVNEKPLEEVLADISLVPEQFTLYELYKSFVLQRLAVINISQRYHKVEKFSFLIANQMQLYTVNKAYARAFAQEDFLEK